MSDLISKISSYNIFNYLLPGTLFAAVGDKVTSYELIQDDLLVALFFYYFIGLVISRVGSLLIEPLLKKVQFLTYADYRRFISASRSDEKITELSEANNMYRTLCSFLICLVAFVAFDRYAIQYPIFFTVAPYVGTPLLLFLFLCSWRKQSSYIVKRVNASSEESR